MLLLVAGWSLPEAPPSFPDRPEIVERAIIRIRSERKWPDKVVLVASRTTLSGHLRSDLIRIIALSTISGRSGKLGGASGKDQPATSRSITSALPTTKKYLATGTADSSRELSNRGQPMA